MEKSHLYKTEGGSPPRVRGRVPAGTGKAAKERITPARAGKSERREVPPRGGRDHPRACGEEHFAVPEALGRVGSPPRVRGRGGLLRYLQGGDGITPARAGKSILLASPSSCSWDHPRACGEERRKEVKNLDCSGSPPRVRGRARRVRKKWIGKRITPARAGKRLLHFWHTGLAGDHPRACGEELPCSR